MSKQLQLADVGLIGLAVMGENLVLNMNDHGYRVCVFNRTTSKIDDFLKNRANGTNVIASYSVEEFVSKLKTPRIIILMVMAGKPVDEYIAKLIQLLNHGDIIIDAGNSDFTDTQVALVNNRTRDAIVNYWRKKYFLLAAA
uniref:6-phosphogluconate dehydrogenase, decarboxylating (Trinotate prediction) n=1 Tax=Henneguya salminicola TaxID=69463 RepID=A0A6G3MJ52_HENSL